VLANHVAKLIPVKDDEAFRFGAMRWSSARRSSQQPVSAAGRGPHRRRVRSVEVELDEFLKAGGSAKCLTLRLDGEEARRGKAADIAKSLIPH